MAQETVNFKLKKPEMADKIENTIPDLAGNFDKIDAEFKKQADDIAANKTDYATYKDTNNIKVAKVEKDLNDYQKAMQGVNVNQEPTQKISGFGIVSLPKNATNSQFSAIKVMGNTVTNLLGSDGDFINDTNADGLADGWINSNFAIVSLSNDIQKVKSETSGFFRRISKSFNFIPYNEYAILYNARKITSVGGEPLVHLVITGEVTESVITNTNFERKILRRTAGVLGTTEIRFGIPTSVTGEIEIDEVMLLNLTQLGSTGLTNAEILAKYNHISGTKSTFSSGGRIKSVGKNLFDGRFPYLGGLTSVGVADGINTKIITSYIRVKPNTTYIFKNFDGVAISRACGYTEKSEASFAQLISNSSSISELAFTTGNNVNFIRISFSTTNLSTKVAVYEGTSALVYEHNTESSVYIPAKEGGYRSLPNGVKDEFNAVTGEQIQRIGSKVLQASDITGMNTTTYSNADYVSIPKPLDYHGRGTWEVQNVIMYTLGNYSYATNINTVDDAMNHNKVAGWASQTSFWLIVPKGTYANLAAAQAALTGLTLTYQLATPVVTQIAQPQNLISFPSGTVYSEPVLPDAGIYTNKMAILNTNALIKKIDKLSKVDYLTGVETKLDVNKAVIAGDKKSFTHPDLANGSIVFFEYEYEHDGTVPEMELGYYDSRYVIKDSVTSKMYKWTVGIANGVPSIAITEV